MIKSFSCGQYTFRISGSNKLVDLIPDSWEKYRQDEIVLPKTIAISLEEDHLECKVAVADNWIIQERQGFPMAVYCQNGKALFGLQYAADPHTVTVCVRKALGSYLRVGIHYGLMLSLHRDCVGLHGVTILCGEEVIILSAPSGTGKSTLSGLLERYCDAIAVNGDFALLHPTEDGVFFEPTPFCGTSRRALNHRFRVNRLVFLEQAKDNCWISLNGREAMKRFMSNCFLPIWDNQLQQTVQMNILKCISLLKTNVYGFAPTQEAAEMFLKKIEEDGSPFSE